jgi:protein phosphatase
MGTTLTAIAWHHGQVAVAHVGDSRAYQLRDGELKQLTVDHTYVQMLVESGRITPDEALTHARRNLIMRAIDGVTDVEADLIMLDARAGDRLLLCSDGLSGVVSSDDISRLLGTGDPPYAAGALVEKALENGAPDNVTVVVAAVVEVDDDMAAALEQAQPVVVGAAGERRNREILSDLEFPDDAEPDPTALPVSVPSEPVEIGSGAGVSAVSATPAGTPGGRHAQPGGRRRWVMPLLAILGIGALLAVATTAAVAWARSQYYVTTSDGKVAIYQGLTVSLPLVSSSTPYYVSDVAVTALPTIAQDALATPAPAADLESAQRLVAQYASQSAACTAAPTTPGCPTPSGLPTAPASPSPSVTVAPAPAGSP